jgi:hypothetical protein
MYDPGTGRWLNEDPIRLKGGDADLNRYVENDPTNATDPTGLELLAYSETSAKSIQKWLAGDASEIGKQPEWGASPKVKIETKLEETATGRWVITPTSFAPVWEAEGKQGKELSAPLAVLEALHSTTKHVEVYWKDGKFDYEKTTLHPWEAWAVNQSSSKYYYMTDTTDEDHRLAEGLLAKGVPVDPNVTDKAGPNVTEWFGKEVHDQIEYRQKKEKVIRGDVAIPTAIYDFFSLPSPFGPLNGMRQAETYKYQVKYLVSDKWMDFGSPNQGKGMNTVILGDRVLRKNQLGNIILGVLAAIAEFPSDLVDKDGVNPVGAMTADKSPDNMMAYAWHQVAQRYDWFRKDGTDKEKEDKGYHPHADNWYLFQGERRADNLAAIGVGVTIGEQIKAKMARGKIPSPEVISEIVEKLMKDDVALEKAVNRYSDWYGQKFTVNTLTTIEYYGGFNTNSLQPDKNTPKYEGPNGIDYFNNVLDPAHKKYMKERQDAGYEGYKIDWWLKKYRENYKNPKGLP